MPTTIAIPDKPGMQSIKLGFGIMVKPLDKQLDAQEFKYNKERIKGFEECRQALLTLNLGGVLTDPQYDKFRDKLHNKILRHVCKANNVSLHVDLRAGGK